MLENNNSIRKSTNEYDNQHQRDQMVHCVEGCKLN